MKVLYDHQTFTLQSYGGISRYFFELMSSFDRSGLVDFKLPIEYSNNHYLHGADFIKDIKRFQTADEFFFGLRFRGKAKIYRLARALGMIAHAERINKRHSIASLREGGFDVFHPTYYDPYFLDCIGGKPFVLTIHDMTHELILDRRFTSYKDPVLEQKKILAERASRIIAVSENTKRDIIRIYGTDAGKIDVVYHGSSLNGIHINKSAAYDLPGRYILFVGDRMRYKNFSLFIEAVSELLRSDRDLMVVCAGGSGFSGNERALFRSMGLSERILHRTISGGGDLAAIYHKALAFVFPSLYEGFGIPVLEAFSCGCPAILSNASSLPEVGGGAAVYFDPSSAGSLREAVAGVIYDEKTRAKLVKNGYERSRQFSWEKTARETARVYEGAV